MGYAQADCSNYNFESAFSPEEEALREKISRVGDDARYWRHQAGAEAFSAVAAKKIAAEWAAKGNRRMEAQRLQAALQAEQAHADALVRAGALEAELAALEAELAALQAEQDAPAAEELLIGFNLNCSVGVDGLIVVDDTCGGGNPAADVRATPGTYVVTRQEGRAPGDVAYYGRAVV